MPEGPEVRIVADALGAQAVGCVLAGVAWDPETPGIADLSPLSFPARVAEVGCHGKRLIFALEGPAGRQYLLCSLMMGARWFWTTPEALAEFRARPALRRAAGPAPGPLPGAAPRLPRVPDEAIIARYALLAFDVALPGAAGCKSVLCFADKRKLGRAEVAQLLPAKDIGHDVLAAALGVGTILAPPRPLTAAAWREALARFARRQVCQALMDQRGLAGIGNYLKAEILYAAGVAPARRVESLTDAEHERLRRATLEIVRRAYEAGGTTIKDFKGLAGAEGEFRPAVYGCARDPAGRAVARWARAEGLLDGRTTYWVPEAQR